MEQIIYRIIIDGKQKNSIGEEIDLNFEDNVFLIQNKKVKVSNNHELRFLKTNKIE